MNFVSLPSYRAPGGRQRAQSDRSAAHSVFIVAIPLLQKARVGAYIVRQQLAGRRRYPLVLMLEPLFRCNLACAGCGKIDYPDEILRQRLSVDECLAAVDECGAPVVSIAGGEPLLHKEIDAIAGNPEEPTFDNTIVALKALVEGSRKDPGNVRFEAMQQKARTNHFQVVELWADQKANDAHELAAHTREFRNKAADFCMRLRIPTSMSSAGESKSKAPAGTPMRWPSCPPGRPSSSSACT